MSSQGMYEATLQRVWGATHLACAPQAHIYNSTATHLVQVTYEAYGAGGTGFIMECLTDNLNRSASEVRSAVQKAGGKMADPGSVMFNFQRQGQVFVSSEASEDQVSSHKLLLVHSFLHPCNRKFLLTLCSHYAACCLICCQRMVHAMLFPMLSEMWVVVQSP